MKGMSSIALLLCVALLLSCFSIGKGAEVSTKDKEGQSTEVSLLRAKIEELQQKNADLEEENRLLSEGVRECYTKLERIQDSLGPVPPIRPLRGP